MVLVGHHPFLGSKQRFEDLWAFARPHRAVAQKSNLPVVFDGAQPFATRHGPTSSPEARPERSLSHLGYLSNDRAAGTFASPLATKFVAEKVRRRSDPTPSSREREKIRSRLEHSKPLPHS